MAKQAVPPTTESASRPVAADPRGRKFGQVLDAARDELLLNSFDRASMDAVAARAGVSKATIYAYFKSKEDMFQAVVLDEVNRLRQGIEAIGSGSKRSLTSKLREVGVHLLRVWLSPRTLPLLRILIAEVDRFEEFARAAHRATKEQVICATAQMLDAGVRDGEIVCRDTKKAADLFMCLVGADHMLTALLDPGKTLPCEDFEAHAKWAVEVFLRVYDPRA